MQILQQNGKTQMRRPLAHLGHSTVRRWTPVSWMSTRLLRIQICEVDGRDEVVVEHDLKEYGEW